MAKRALCVGIDRFQGTGIPKLQGCVHDARSVARLLTDRFGFSEVKDLLDDRATKENILRAIDWLVMNSAPGDQAVLFVSSYGSWFPDRSGSDTEGLDEVVVAHDHNAQWTVLRDDEIAQAIGKFPSTVGVVCMLDTCSQGEVTAGRFLAPDRSVPQIFTAMQKRLQVQGRLRQRIAAELPNCVVFNACAEGEVAGETAFTGGVGGTFTLALLEALSAATPETTWGQVHAHAVKNLQARGFKQTPQMHAAEGMRSQRLFQEMQTAPSPTPTWGASPAPAAVPSWGAAPASIAAASSGYGLPQPSSPIAVTFESHLITPVDTALGAFDGDDYTVKLCDGIMKVLPFVPAATPYAKLNEALRKLHPQATAPMLVRAQEYASSEAVSKTLWVANAIDTGDAGIAVFSGLKSAFGLFTGKRMDALETDPQQAVDAALKLLGISYMVFKLFPGSIVERVQSFYALPAGQHLTAYYAAVEVALPFADNGMLAGGNFLSSIMQRHGGDALSKFQSIAGQDAVQGSQGVLASMMGYMESAVQRVAPFARQIADTATQYMPGALNVADKVAGVVATGADAMPVYRYLGARLAAEACAQVALRG